MKYLVICFACIFVYRLATNISAFIRISYYDKEYTMYLSHPERDFTKNTTAVVHLFKKSGMTDLRIPYVQPMGYGQILQGHTSFFSNIDNRREDVVANMIKCFSEAKGTFKYRILENFSPLFWIERVLFLPRTILEYLGVDGNSLIVKLFQLLYWIITPFLIFFRGNIYQHIISLIGQL